MPDVLPQLADQISVARAGLPAGDRARDQRYRRRAAARGPVRCRLSAGGRWIRTLGPPVEDGAWACFRGATGSSGGPIAVRT
jgi:hypothetical protein